MTLEAEIRRIVREELARAKPANDAPTDYLSVAEAAERARVSVYTIRRWVKRGELTRHVAGARLLVKRDELEALLACEVVSIDSRLPADEWVKRRFG